MYIIIHIYIFILKMIEIAMYKIDVLKISSYDLLYP